MQTDSYIILPNGYTLNALSIFKVSKIYNQLEIDEEEDESGCDFEGEEDKYFIYLYIKDSEPHRIESDDFQELVTLRNEIIDKVLEAKGKPAMPYCCKHCCK